MRWLSLGPRDPHVREQVQRLLGLPSDRVADRLEALAAAQAKTDASVRELADAQARTDASVKEFAAAQARTDASVKELAAAQARTDASLEALAGQVTSLAG